MLAKECAKIKLARKTPLIKQVKKNNSVLLSRKREKILPLKQVKKNNSVLLSRKRERNPPLNKVKKNTSVLQSRKPKRKPSILAKECAKKR